MSILNRSNTLTVEILKLSNSATVPSSAHLSDVGLDLYSDEDVFIKTGDTAIVKTGVALGLPLGFYGKIEDRSSMASMGLRTGGGVVDAGYNGEIKVILHNLNNTNDSTYRGQGYQIKKGQRIAQLVVQPVIPVRLTEVENLQSSERGTNGFGSSGR